MSFQQPQQSDPNSENNVLLIYLSFLPFLYCGYWYMAHFSPSYLLGSISYWELAKWFMLSGLAYVFACNGRNATRWLVYNGAIVYLGHYIFWYGIPYVAVKIHSLLPFFSRAVLSGEWEWIVLRVLLSLPWGAVAAALMIKLAAFGGGWECISFRSENYSDFLPKKALAAQTAVPTPAQPTNPSNGKEQMDAGRGFNIPGVDIYINRRPDPLALDKIIGLEKPKEIVMKAMEMILSGDKTYAEYGLTPPGGLLLYGPPGTGKTSFARACAEALGCTFYVVNASSLLGSLVGQSEQAVRNLFAHARAHRPAIIFWDEIDAVGQRRDGMNLNRPSDLILNILLAEMDGFNAKREKGVLVIGATNRIDVLDEALLRPGRFDFKIEVGLPGFEDRVKLLQFFLKGRKAEGITAEGLKEIAGKMDGWSPADLKALVDEAAWRALKKNEPITTGAIKAALEQHNS